MWAPSTTHSGGRFHVPRPANPDWSKQLTIWQAATDQHRIIESFKDLYRQNWLTTGGSKGGMTATYHRHFYPKDVDGTVPYVAPNDVVDTDDVYNAFLDEVGTDRTRADSEANGYTYDIVGDMDTAMESGVVDMYFAFWQYSPQSECANVPNAATATNEQVWSFFENVSPLTVYSDQSVSYYTPYYYQAAYQLGAPEPYETRIGDLLNHPGADVALTFVPQELKPIDFDEKAMPAVDRWVRTTSRQMLYIYGGTLLRRGWHPRLADQPAPHRRRGGRQRDDPRLGRPHPCGPGREDDREDRQAGEERHAGHQAGLPAPPGALTPDSSATAPSPEGAVVVLRPRAWRTTAPCRPGRRRSPGRRRRRPARTTSADWCPRNGSAGPGDAPP